jgi:tetratricopeptide (TPR) repeat protein
VSELNLVQKRNHILRSGIDALDEPGRQLLSTLALLSEAVDYDTLAALNPHLSPEPEPVPEPHDPADIRWWDDLAQDEQRTAWQQYEVELARHVEYQGALTAWRSSPAVVAAPRRLAATVADLERRRLLQYDPQAGRDDLHPVVRAVAARSLRATELDRLGTRVVDHFSTRPHPPYEDAETLDDLRDGVTVVRALQRLGRWAEAAESYRGPLARALYFNLDADRDMISLLRPFFPAGWAAPVDGPDESARGYLVNSAALTLHTMGEQEQALALHGQNLEAYLGREDWSGALVALFNAARVLGSQNGLARSERCREIALRLAERLEDPENLTRARLDLFTIAVVLGRTATAEWLWAELDAMGRDWSRAAYRPGDAELWHVEFRFHRGRLTDGEIDRALRLARDGRNRSGVRDLLRLRGAWLAERGEWASAADSLADAVRMARETGSVDVGAETRLALARHHLGQLPDPREEAEHLAALRDPARLPLAELWRALGDTARATEHALAAYRWAWADGEPYVHRFDLDRATALLTELGAEIPDLPAYDPAADPPLPFEARVEAAIERLRAERNT